MQTLFEKIEVLLHSLAALRGKFKHEHARPHSLDITIRSCPIEFDRLRQVNFADHGNIGAVKNCRIFERLVLAFRYRDENKPKILAKVVGRRTDQVANIFNKQEIKLVEIPILERVLDHCGFKMTKRARGDLLNRGPGAGQSDGIVLGSEISDKRGYAVMLTEQSERLFQKTWSCPSPGWTQG